MHPIRQLHIILYAHRYIYHKHLNIQTQIHTYLTRAHAGLNARRREETWLELKINYFDTIIYSKSIDTQQFSRHFT